MTNTYEVEIILSRKVGVVTIEADSRFEAQDIALSLAEGDMDAVSEEEIMQRRSVALVGKQGEKLSLKT